MTFLGRLRALLLRRTQPNDIGARFGPVVMRTAGQYVGEDTAFTVSAFWCCVRVIAETISQMPWRTKETVSEGKTRIADGHPADRLLNRAPNAEQDAATWRELMLRWVLVRGNAYCEIERDASYRPVALWPLDPRRVTPRRAGGMLWYQVRQPTGADEYLPAADVLHFRGLGDELEGWSVLTYAARCLGLGMAQENSMASQMEHGTKLSGVLMPMGGGTMPPKMCAQLQTQFAQQHGGSDNHGKVYFLQKGLEFKQIGMPNDDAQLLESRQFSVIDLCRFFRVPPHLVYDLTRATFSNITHQSLEFLIHTLGPWICKLEQQANAKLISPSAGGRLSTELDAPALLRMDPETRIAYYRGLRELGSISPNEIRRREGLDSLGKKGDVYLVPVNMQTLEQAGKAPDAAPRRPLPADRLPEGNGDGQPPFDLAGARRDGGN